MKRITRLKWVHIHEEITAIILPLEKNFEAFCFRNLEHRHTYRLPLSDSFRLYSIIYFVVGRLIFIFGWCKILYNKLSKSSWIDSSKIYFRLFALRNVFTGNLFEENLVQAEAGKYVIMTVIKIIKCFCPNFWLIYKIIIRTV